MATPEPDLDLASCVLCGRELPADPVVRDLGGTRFPLHAACAEAGLEGAGLASPYDATTEAEEATKDPAQATNRTAAEAKPKATTEADRGAGEEEPRAPSSPPTPTPSTATAGGGDDVGRSTRLDEFL